MRRPSRRRCVSSAKATLTCPRWWLRSMACARRSSARSNASGQARSSRSSRIRSPDSAPRSPRTAMASWSSRGVARGSAGKTTSSSLLSPKRASPSGRRSRHLSPSSPHARFQPMIAVRETGLVYRNPRPELRSRHTWHPTIVRFDDGEMLVTFDIAEADVALDYRTYATHSTDAGTTWTSPERVVPDPPGRPTTQSVRSNRMSDGSVVAMGALMYRDDPEKSVVNVPSLGYTELELILTRSQDRGQTWSPIER